MAKKLSQEDLVLNIIVNSNKAQSEIGQLSRALQDNKSKLSAAEAEMKRLERQGATSSQRYRDLQQSVARYNTAIDDQRRRLEALNQSLRLEDQTQKQLETSLRRITQLRKQALPGSEDHSRFTAEIQAITERLRELQIGADETGGSLQNMANTLNQYIGLLVAGGASLTGFWSTAKRATDEYAKFDDILADVMKTTNLNKNAVKELNAELETLQTRTSQEDLLGLGRIAGKLGYNEVNDVVEFVKANNEIIVALNEDLGGNVEETVNKIGKLVDVFKLKDMYTTEDAFRKVGSAINELGMASTANEGYMVEFARRMAGVAPLAGITIEQILGLGATLDQLGQSEEVSSTALSKLFLTMAKDAATYSKYAGMEINSFKKLLEEDFMAAFTKVLQGVKNNSAGINELAATLGDLSQDGGRTIGVIGTLANNVDILTDSISLSNKSMSEGTSITNEYNIKNQTAGAKLDMARKEVAKFWRELGEKLWPVMTEGNNIMITFLKVLTTIINFISENIKVITLLTIAITGYTIVVNAAAIATYAKAKALAIVTAAQRLFNAAVSANPLGILIVAITTAAAALYLYRNRTDAATIAQNNLNDALKSAKADYEKETSAIEDNLKVALDKSRADDIRLTAVKNLRNIMPSVLKGYSDEEIMANKATAAIKEQIKQIIALSTVKAYQSKLDDLAVQRVEKLDQLKRGYRGATATERFNAMPDGFFSSDWESAYNLSVQKELDAIEASRQLIGETVIKEQNELNKMFVRNKPTTPVDNGGTVSLNGSAVSEKDRNKAYRNELEAAEIRYQTLLQKEKLFREDLSEMSKEDLERLVVFQNDYQKTVDDINKKYGESLKTTTNTAQKELDKRSDAEKRYLDSVLIRNQTEVEAEKNAYNDRLAKAGLFDLDLKNMNERQKNALEILQREHQLNIVNITKKGINDELDELKSAYKEELSEMRIAHYEELSNIKTLSQAKSVLSKTMNERELKQISTLAHAKKIISNRQMLDEEYATRQHLETLIKMFEDAVSSNNFEGIDLASSLLPEEKKKILMSNIRELKEEIAKLKGQDISAGIGDADKNDRDNMDVLGMTVENWEKLFANVGTTREKLMRMYGALEAVIKMWSEYNNMVSASENAQLQKDEEANNKKKENLKTRLDSGVITQDQYNKEVDQLDKKMDRKKAELARKQAKREKSIALAGAIVNTAKAVTAVLPNFVLAAIVGAFGALQVGTIASTPLPSVEGREAGGFLKVERAQDGKVFNANMDPDKRGYVTRPTVLVGEKGTEWVANADAVSNPAVKPIIEILDQAQRNGTISTIGLTDILAATATRRVNGKQSGGTFSEAINQYNSSGSDNSLLIDLFQQQFKVIKTLSDQLKNGIKADVNMLGPKGFVEQQNELNDIKSRAEL
ncbi:phage tail tape measure protein [Sphingobacterium spiritivorum]|uniref:phage tail tape measure protein n=1 Tax=Sphingobacterium spiritivorum TaxID=258 RepID=UPI003DA3FEE2